MELLATMADNSLDAVVTDCPYGLGKEPDATETLQAWVTSGYHEIKGSGFMGKEWDAFVPQPIFWKEVFRVLKPGGYVLAFFGTRTYDWGTMAIRLAGFEIRDCIQWIYGSGFPKSLDVSKAIDKASGVDREDKWEGIGRKIGPTGNIKCDKCGKWLSSGNPCLCPRPQDQPQTDAAKTWEGYGTALKPAYEPICVARKPLDGTVANNVLKHECGAINLNGCRIDTEDDLKGGNGILWSHIRDEKPSQKINPSELGRFPANIIFDQDAAAVLDEQSGTLTSGKPCGVKAGNNNNVFGQYAGGIDVTGYGDSGGASRFFYVAKASKEDRNYGCAGMEEKQYSHDGRHVHIENAYQRHNSKAANNHPTVKPITLMRYLVRLVKTPFDTCTIADFFMGSGSTGVACMLEGINFIGCDDDANSFQIAQSRIEYAKQEYLKELSKPKQVELFDIPSLVKPQRSQANLFS